MSLCIGYAKKESSIIKVKHLFITSNLFYHYNRDFQHYSSAISIALKKTLNGAHKMKQQIELRLHCNRCFFINNITK